MFFMDKNIDNTVLTSCSVYKSYIYSFWNYCPCAAWSQNNPTISLLLFQVFIFYFGSQETQLFNIHKKIPHSNFKAATIHKVNIIFVTKSKTDFQVFKYFILYNFIRTNRTTICILLTRNIVQLSFI